VIDDAAESEAAAATERETSDAAKTEIGTAKRAAVVRTEIELGIQNHLIARRKTRGRVPKGKIVITKKTRDPANEKPEMTTAMTIKKALVKKV
jgi:hypothetical protein